MLAEECLEIVKVHMMAAESVGKIPEAVALSLAYAAVSQAIWDSKTIDEKCAAWKKRGFSDAVIKQARECGLNG